jgi:hypothetical protein
MIEIMILRRDLARLRALTPVRMIQPGDMWCLVQVDSRTTQWLRPRDFWYEL